MPIIATSYASTCEKAARSAGKILLNLWGETTPHEKGPRDLVTEADFAAQKVIEQTLLDEYPDHGFLGEESEPSPTTDTPLGWREVFQRHEFCWVVDPLDGTTNFVHQLQSFAVSIALLHHGETILGGVFDPVLDQYYQAVQGGGATLNGKLISVSRCEHLEKALVATSLPANVQRGSVEVARFEEVLYVCRALRRLGSAALNLCYVAAGRLDAYWATSVKPWDVAAGILLVREAGGVVTAVDGGPFQVADPKFSAAASSPLNEQLIATLKQA